MLAAFVAGRPADACQDDGDSYFGNVGTVATRGCQRPIGARALSLDVRGPPYALGNIFPEFVPYALAVVGGFHGVETLEMTGLQYSSDEEGFVDGVFGALLSNNAGTLRQVAITCGSSPEDVVYIADDGNVVHPHIVLALHIRYCDARIPPKPSLLACTPDRRSVRCGAVRCGAGIPAAWCG